MLVAILDVLQSLLLIVFLLGLIMLVIYLAQLVSKAAWDGEDYAPQRDPRTGLLRYHRQTRFQEKPVLSESSASPPPLSRLGCMPRLFLGIWRFSSWAFSTALLRPAPARPLSEAPERDVARRSGEKDEPDEEKSSRTVTRVAVIRFNGMRDLQAVGDQRLSEAIDEVLVNRDCFEEVVVIIDSPGGTTHGYGHAYALLERVRAAGLELTACIDRVGASGGYLMALPAKTILASPFAIVGSVGVVAAIPNVRRFLEDKGVSYRVFVAGDRKRIVHFADDDGPEVRQYMDEKLASIHEQFVRAVQKHRGDRVPLEQVRSGDHWSAAESIERGLGLVDELQTSADYLLERNREAPLVWIERRVDLAERVSGLFVARLRNRVASLFSGGIRL